MDEMDKGPLRRAPDVSTNVIGVVWIFVWEEMGFLWGHTCVYRIWQFYAFGLSYKLVLGAGVYFARWGVQHLPESQSQEQSKTIIIDLRLGPHPPDQDGLARVVNLIAMHQRPANQTR